MKKYLIIVAMLGVYQHIAAQLCQNSVDSVYGLTAVGTPGQVVGVNLINAGTTTIGLPAAGAVAANAIGFNQVDGRFYFFNQVGAGTIEFVSFNPETASKIALTNPPLLPTNQRIRSGVVSRLGGGYYMIYPGATIAQGYPQNGPALYYYNIALNTWTLITQNFLNTSGTNIANIATLNSGDMAFDGNDNLWLICSNSTNHALYKISAPLPTTAVASVLVDTIIAQRGNPVAGVSFTGVAFNAAGILYLSTGSGAGPGNNLLYSMATISSPFTLIGTVPNSFGDDLTSCVYPVAVLGVKWLSYSVSTDGSFIYHNWKVAESDPSPVSYVVESSTNGYNWKPEEVTFPQNGITGTQVYTVKTHARTDIKQYFRIARKDIYGRTIYSPVRSLAITGSETTFSLYPNPAKGILSIASKKIVGDSHAYVYDMSGKTVMKAFISAGQQTIDIQKLKAGVYFLKLINPKEITDNVSMPVMFIKE